MAPRSVELFASADEQLQWLQTEINDTTEWLVLERPRINQLEEKLVSDLDPSSLGNEFSSARLFLGQRDVAKPKWEWRNGRRELEFVGSMAVLFEPSIVRRDSIVAGRLAIMKANEYKESGADPHVLENWYKKLVRSLIQRIGVTGVSLVVKDASGHQAKARGQFVVSDRAAELVRQGLELKQFAESRLTMAILKE